MLPDLDAIEEKLNSGVLPGFYARQLLERCRQLEHALIEERTVKEAWKHLSAMASDGQVDNDDPI